MVTNSLSGQSEMSSLLGGDNEDMLAGFDGNATLNGGAAVDVPNGGNSGDALCGERPALFKRG